MALHFHPLRVASVERDTEDAVVVRFDAPADGSFAFEPGQYLTLRTELGGQEVRRSYSLCSDRQLQVGIRRVDGGVFSTWAHEQLQPGDVIEAYPPQGRFVLPPAPAEGRHVLFIAGGSGITPMMGLMAALLEREPASRATLIYANRRTASTMFKEALEDLKNRFMTRLSLHHVFSREAVDAPLYGGRLDAGKLSAFLAGPVPAASVDEVFVCGPFEMNDQAEAALRGAGLPAERIHIERFGTPQSMSGQPAPHETKPGDAAEARVTVIRDGMSREIEFHAGDPSLLDAAAREGMDVPFSCKSGVCSTCRCKLLEGQVRMDRNFALDKDEVAAGFILSCQAHPLTDRVVISFDER
ncbi:MAG: phenylacetate-CoA oxygenase/reductase subunit PaaK [Proteobacteria bacterium]|jgi:ring-1,2-phenylacetyl-CoA epoxidase subunit PaaE|nr:phenylacetate-CoA oxygenase/reductase subunit PaaK [Methylibium sp.]MBY0364839.1 phenylacetate-CoA oxygenase/reductase subunit PaaK [Burkholderiaceae bacterium]MCH8856928.1 phenylacetate-CoA oxygenase/reductase subunit PaaK [Pseudomonadota bacterium]